MSQWWLTDPKSWQCQGIEITVFVKDRAILEDVCTQKNTLFGTVEENQWVLTPQ